MRLTHVLPYAALIVLGQAAIGSVPDVVAVREGGMGLGSALLMAQLAQVAGVAFGAVTAAHVVDRWSAHAALVMGALLYYAGLIGVGHQPAHHLGWVVAILGLAGAGLGAVLTAGFAAAAAPDDRLRPFGIALLLLAVVLGSTLVDNAVFGIGPAALVVVAAVIVAGALLVARGARKSVAREPLAADSDGTYSGWTAAAAGGLLATGIMAALWGLDPSRVSAAMVAASLGIGGVGAMDGIRAGLVLVGVVVAAAGMVVLTVRRRPGRGVVLAAAAVAFAALAVTGLVAVAGFGMPRDLSAPNSRGGPIGELALVVGGGAGLALGAWLLTRGTAPRVVAVAGAVILSLLGLVTVVDAGSVIRTAGAIGPVAAIVAAAFGGGLTSVALRLVLARVPAGERGFAAAAGVVAAAFGAIAGVMIGGADGVSAALGVTDGTPVGFVVVAVAALVATAIAASLRGAELADPG